MIDYARRAGFLEARTRTTERRQAKRFDRLSRTIGEQIDRRDRPNTAAVTVLALTGTGSRPLRPRRGCLPGHSKGKERVGR